MKPMFALWLLLLLAGAGALFALQGCSPLEPHAGTAYVSSIEDDVPVDHEPIDTGDSPTHTTNSQPIRHRPRDPSLPGGADWLSSFELIERSGETIHSQELRGQPYVVGFFFTLCPSICLNQNAKVKELQDKYLGQPIRLLSISCDPEVDRPEVLREYAQRFDADPEQWLFLTGEMDYITRVAGEMYFLAAERRFHAEKFVLVDGEGNNVGFYTWSDPLQFKELERDIDKLLSGQKVDRETINAKTFQAATPK